jgi:hypothetical protein
MQSGSQGDVGGTAEVFEEEESWADYFAGPVPAGLIFDGDLADLRDLVRSRPSSKRQGLDPIAELVFIGLLTYFRGKLVSVNRNAPG